MKKNIKNKKAFTLLEAVVVLAVTVIVLSFGVIGVVNFRKSIELKNGYSDLITNIKTINNNSKNSIASSNGEAPKYYVISFKNNNYSYELCFEESSFNLNCNIEQENMKGKRFNSIQISSTCEKIAFQRLSTEIVALDNLNSLQSIETCSLKVSHPTLNKTYTIIFDLVSNTVNYE